MQSKIRPVLVLWLDGDDAIVAAVTSAEPRGATDLRLALWKEAGLRVASTVRLGRLCTMETSLLFSKLGRISEEDADSILAVWGKEVRPSF